MREFQFQTLSLSHHWLVLLHDRQGDGQGRMKKGLNGTEEREKHTDEKKREEVKRAHREVN